MARRDRTLTNTCVKIPREIPFAILKVSGIHIIVIKAGSDSRRSFQSIRPTVSINIAPIIINAGAVATDGTADAMGHKNNDNKNMIPVTTATKPVLPPSSMPAADSIYAVVVDVPITAPIVVANASVANACPALGIRPS